MTFGPMIDDWLDIGIDYFGGIGTYSTVCNSKQAKKHILVSARRNLTHHRLRIRIVWGLEKAKQYVVNPQITHAMISNNISPEAQHSVERNKHRECVRNHEHVFRFDVEILLDVPKPKCRESRRGGLSKAKVGELEEREGHNVVLDDRYKSACSVEAVGKEKEGKQIDEGLGKVADFAES